MSDESEEACLVNSRATTHTTTGAGAPGAMPYTDGIQSGLVTQQQMNASSGRGSQQSHESETGELIEYNDELILSQFHADAIKQVHSLNKAI